MGGDHSDFSGVVRPTTPADAAAVSRILRASYEKLYRGWYRDDALEKALPAMTRANPVLLSSGRYFVVEMDRAVVACGGWSADCPAGGAMDRRAHLRHFATDPAYLNRGCAGAIVQRCFSAARAAGYVEFEVISSLTAEAFYARRGFMQIAHVRQPMGGVDFACVLMRKKLEAAE
ncbi:MAG: GNAT family N-acetyltransferase [Parvularculaceae bacterium]|nr:GNAT family N-acetyltransferase [Parvularculaceae bacterium]